MCKAVFHDGLCDRYRCPGSAGKLAVRDYSSIATGVMPLWLLDRPLPARSVANCLGALGLSCVELVPNIRRATPTDMSLGLKASGPSLSRGTVCLKDGLSSRLLFEPKLWQTLFLNLSGNLLPLLGKRPRAKTNLPQRGGRTVRVGCPFPFSSWRWFAALPVLKIR